MRTWLIIAGPLVAILEASVVQAQETVDVAKITCDQFLASKVVDSRTLSIWVSGYYNGTRNNTVLDVSALQKREQDVIDYCPLHSEMIFMGAVKSVLGSNSRCSQPISPSSTALSRYCHHGLRRRPRNFSAPKPVILLGHTASFFLQGDPTLAAQVAGFFVR